MPVENPVELDQARSWARAKLEDLTGASAGRVEDVFVDADSGEPAWLVFRIGRFGHRSAIPCELAAGGADRVWVPFSRDLIRSAPAVDPATGLDPAAEAELCDHWGVAAGQGRRRALAGREAGLSAVPDQTG